jgi:hypothetical protein
MTTGEPQGAAGMPAESWISPAEEELRLCPFRVMDEDGTPAQCSADASTRCPDDPANTSWPGTDLLDALAARLGWSRPGTPGAVWLCEDHARLLTGIMDAAAKTVLT